MINVKCSNEKVLGNMSGQNYVWVIIVLFKIWHIIADTQFGLAGNIFLIPMLSLNWKPIEKKLNVPLYLNKRPLLLQGPNWWGVPGCDSLARLSNIQSASVCHSVRPKWKSSYSHNFSRILTKFLHHVYITEKFYNMLFHKKVPKIVAMATVFLFHLSGISVYVCSLHESMKVPSSKLLQYLHKGPT